MQIIWLHVRLIFDQCWVNFCVVVGFFFWGGMLFDISFVGLLGIMLETVLIIMLGDQ